MPPGCLNDTGSCSLRSRPTRGSTSWQERRPTRVAIGLIICRRGDINLCKGSASDNTPMSCEILQQGHCFTVKPVVIFAWAERESQATGARLHWKKPAQ
jgi:hypothetical protein